MGKIGKRGAKFGECHFSLLSRYGPKLNKAVLLRERVVMDQTITVFITKPKRRQCAGAPQLPSCAAPAKNCFQQTVGYYLVRETYLASSGDRTRRSTASIKRVFTFVMLSSVGSGQDAGPNVCPGTVVEGLLLCVQTYQSWRCESIVHVRTWHQRISALGYASR